MRIPKQSRPIIRNRYLLRSASPSARGITAQINFCEIACAAAEAACIASGVPAAICAAGGVACKSAC